MSNSKIKLSDILKEKRQSENSFIMDVKKTELTLEDLERKLSLKEPVKEPEPASSRLDNILQRLSKIKQPIVKPDRILAQPQNIELCYDFLPSKISVPKSVKDFFENFDEGVIGNVSKIYEIL